MEEVTAILTDHDDANIFRICVDASIADGPWMPIRFVVSTGSTVTCITRSSFDALLSGRDAARVVIATTPTLLSLESGARASETDTVPLRIKLGAHEFSACAVIAPSHSGIDVLGFDILRHCRLVVDGDVMTVVPRADSVDP